MVEFSSSVKVLQGIDIDLGKRVFAARIEACVVKVNPSVPGQFEINGNVFNVISARVSGIETEQSDLLDAIDAGTEGNELNELFDLALDATIHGIIDLIKN